MILKITVDPSKVLDDLGNFPVLITEANLPDRFWENVQADGSDIWLCDTDRTKLKRELVSIGVGARTIELWVKVPSVSGSVDTVIYLNFGDSELSETNDEDTWDDNYVAVHHLEEDTQASAPQFIDSTDSDNDMTVAGGMLQLLEDKSQSPDLNVHEGIAFDGTFYYAIGIGIIYKYDRDWNLIDSSDTILAEAQAILAAEAGYPYSHIVDGNVYNGYLYVPIIYYNYGSGLYKSQRISKVRCSDLAVTDCVDISAQDHGCSGAYVDSAYVYIVSYLAGGSTKIYRYNTDDLSYADSDITIPSLTYQQGITSDGTYFYITYGAKYIRQIKTDGTNVGIVYDFGAEDVEGIEYLGGGQFAVLYDSGALEKIHFLGRKGKVGSGIEFFGSDHLAKTSPADMDDLAAFTFEVWGNYNSAATDNDNRLMEQSGRSGFKVMHEGENYNLKVWRGAWKDYAIGENPEGTLHHFAAAYDGSNVYFYYDGALLGNVACTGSTGGSGTLRLGCYNGTGLWFYGVMDEARVSNTSRSTSWIGTSYNNQNDPSSFYSVDYLGTGWSHPDSVTDPGSAWTGDTNAIDGDKTTLAITATADKVLIGNYTTDFEDCTHIRIMAAALVNTTPNTYAGAPVIVQAKWDGSWHEVWSGTTENGHDGLWTYITIDGGTAHDVTNISVAATFVVVSVGLYEMDAGRVPKENANVGVPGGTIPTDGAVKISRGSEMWTPPFLYADTQYLYHDTFSPPTTLRDSQNTAAAVEWYDKNAHDWQLVTQYYWRVDGKNAVSEDVGVGDIEGTELDFTVSANISLLKGLLGVQTGRR